MPVPFVSRGRSGRSALELLERRPDVRQAEEIIVAANAQIGVAKASFFPSISLTGTGGLESNALNQFISAPAQTWLSAFSVAQPIFEGGALRSGLRLSRAQYQEAVLAYEQTVQTALEQVSNGLIAYQKYRDFRAQQRLLTEAAQRSDQLSMLLYQHGGSSYPGTHERHELFLSGTESGPGAAQ